MDVNISDACTLQIEPDISFQTLEEKTILVIDIALGKYRPYYLKNKGKEESAYIRINGTSRPADSRKLKELEMEGQKISYDSMQNIGDEYNEEEALELCKTMKQIAFQSCKTDEEKAEIKDMTIEKLVQFVLKHINLGAEVDGLFRRDMYELPIKAVREMIANAVAHRSYLDDSCIQVSVYDDRLEVLSPGMLYGGLDMETAKLGKSRCRNVAICEAFQYMHIVEQWGTGIPRIINLCKEYGLPEPLFEEFGDGIKVIMYRKVTSSEPKVTSSEPKVTSSEPKVTSSEPKVTSSFAIYRDILEKADTTKKYISNIEAVYRKFGNMETFRQSDIMEMFGCSKTKAFNIVSTMKKVEIIEKANGLGLGRYKFIDL